MSILEGFIMGIGTYGRAIRILFSKKFSWFLFFPLLLLILLFIGGNMLTSVWGDSLSEIVRMKLSAWISGIPWLHWVNDTSSILIRILLRIIYFIIFLSVGGYIVLIIMSPVYSWLSERTEARLTGKEYPFSLWQLCRDILRGVLIALRNLFFQLGVTVLLFFCSFIPVAGIAVPFVMFFVSAYFYGFSFMDYAVERKRYNIKQSVRYINKNVGIVAGVGSVFALALMIPFFSIVACTFVSVLSVIAATVAVNRLDNYNKK